MASNVDMEANILSQEKTYTICFAGQHWANLFCAKSVASAPWCTGRGYPDDFPLDIWIRGGISLLLKRAFIRQYTISLLGFVSLWIWFIFSRPSWGYWNYIVPAVGAGVIVMGYFWRVLETQRVVTQEIAPRLHYVGYTIECSQWPWFSYYTIRRFNEQTGAAQENTSSSPFELNFSLEVPTVNMAQWDLQGYIQVFPNAHIWPDVWTYGALVETVWVRVFQAENTSPPLVHNRWLRRIRNLALFSLYTILIIGAVDQHYGGSEVLSSAVWAYFQLALFMGVLCALCFTGCFAPVGSPDPINEIINEAINDLGPEIQKRSGTTVKLVQKFGQAYVRIEPTVTNDAEKPPVVQPNATDGNNVGDHGDVV